MRYLGLVRLGTTAIIIITTATTITITSTIISITTTTIIYHYHDHYHYHLLVSQLQLPSLPLLLLQSSTTIMIITITVYYHQHHSTPPFPPTPSPLAHLDDVSQVFHEVPLRADDFIDHVSANLVVGETGDAQLPSRASVTRVLVVPRALVVLLVHQYLQRGVSERRVDGSYRGEGVKVVIEGDEGRLRGCGCEERMSL